MKRVTIFLLIFGFGLVFYSVAQNIVAEGSSINFTIKNFGIHVKGSLAPPKGEIKFDPENLTGSHFDVDVAVAGINTEIPKRDEHLRSADYFDAQKYPLIHFSSTSIIRTSKGYIAYGKLRIKNAEKPVGMPFTYTKNGNKNVFNGSLVINRTDYGIGEKSSVLGNEVSVVIMVTVND